jgi:hypothetical protein
VIFQIGCDSVDQTVSKVVRRQAKSLRESGDDDERGLFLISSGHEWGGY